MSDEALRLLRTIRNHHPFCDGSGCTEIDAFLADKDIPAARESALADSFVAIIEAEDYLPEAFKAKALQVAKAALSIREKALADTSPAAALAQGERIETARGNVSMIWVQTGSLNARYKADALAALSGEEKE